MRCCRYQDVRGLGDWKWSLFVQGVFPHLRSPMFLHSVGPLHTLHLRGRKRCSLPGALLALGFVPSLGTGDRVEALYHHHMGNSQKKWGKDCSGWRQHCPSTLGIQRLPTQRWRRCEEQQRVGRSSKFVAMMAPLKNKRSGASGPECSE